MYSSDYPLTKFHKISKKNHILSCDSWVILLAFAHFPERCIKIHVENVLWKFSIINRAELKIFCSESPLETTTKKATIFKKMRFCPLKSSVRGLKDLEKNSRLDILKDLQKISKYISLNVLKIIFIFLWIFMGSKKKSTKIQVPGS